MQFIYNDNLDFSQEKIANGELTIYTSNGAALTMDFEENDVDLLMLAIMLKSIGFMIDEGSNYLTYSVATLKEIYNGKINPFKE